MRRACVQAPCLIFPPGCSATSSESGGVVELVVGLVVVAWRCLRVSVPMVALIQQRRVRIVEN